MIATISRSGAVVARWAHNPKVVSSSLASATKKSLPVCDQKAFLFFVTQWFTGWESLSFSRNPLTYVPQTIRLRPTSHRLTSGGSYWFPGRRAYISYLKAGKIYFHIKLISACISPIFAVMAITASCSGNIIMYCPLAPSARTALWRQRHIW